MNKFIEAYRHFKQIKDMGYYRFCWIPIGKNGNGIYSIIEFFDEELQKIDKNKCELLILN